MCAPQDKSGCHRRLAVGLEKHALKERDVSGSSAFIDGGYFATPGALRDSDDIGAPVVLDSDVSRFNHLSKAQAPTDALVVTVPKRHARPSDGTGLPRWLGVADGARYDPWLGFLVDEEPKN